MATTQRSKPGAPDRTLSSAQSRYVHNIVKNEFTNYVRTVDPTFVGFAKVSAWVKNKVDDIMNSPEMKEDAENAPTVWKTTITQKFRNHYNQGLKKQYLLNNSGATARDPVIPTVDDRFIKILLPPLTGRQLYEATFKDDLKKQSAGGGIADYQRVLKRGWDGLDEEERQEWDATAASEEGDIEQNRVLLRDNLAAELTRICRDVRFGGMAMFMQISYREPSGKIKCFSAEGGPPDAALFIQDEKTRRVLDTFSLAWRTFSETVLPRAKGPSVSGSVIPIPANTDGIPVFPHVDPLNTPPQALTAIVTAYLEAVWDHACLAAGCEDKPLPWDAIASSPSVFYDNNTFDFLTFSKENLSSPMTIFPLVQSLVERCSVTSPNPFAFTGIGDTFDVSNTKSTPQSLEAPLPVRDSPEPTTSASTPTDSSNPQLSADFSPAVSPVIPGPNSAAFACDGVVWPSTPVSASPAPHLSPLTPATSLSEGTPTLPPQSLPSVPDITIAVAPVPAPRVNESVPKPREESATIAPPAQGKRKRSTRAVATPKPRERNGQPVQPEPATGEGLRQSKRRRVVSKEVQQSVAPVVSKTSCAIKVPRNSIVSKGYVFKKQIGSYEIPLEHYEAHDGSIMQPHEFGLEERVDAKVVAERDPAWLAGFWPTYCLVRPDES